PVDQVDEGPGWVTQVVDRDLAVAAEHRADAVGDGLRGADQVVVLCGTVRPPRAPCGAHVRNRSSTIEAIGGASGRSSPLVCSTRSVVAWAVASQRASAGTAPLSRSTAVSSTSRPKLVKSGSSNSAISSEGAVRMKSDERR